MQQTLLLKSFTLLWVMAASQTVASAQNVQTRSYDIYLMAGQSNMDGRGLTENLPPDRRTPSTGTIIFYRNLPKASDGWQPLGPGFSVPPRFKGELPSHKFGPELGFASAMSKHQPGAALALIKGSKGGSSLRVDWNPGEPGKPETQGQRYRDFLQTIQMATESLKQQGASFEFRGLLWHQGESDSKSSSEIYQKRLERFIQRIREDLERPHLPVVLGEVYDNGKRDSVLTATRTVSEQHTKVGLMTSEGLTTWDNGTHFDADSQWKMGQRYAKAMLQLQDASP